MFTTPNLYMTDKPEHMDHICDKIDPTDFTSHIQKEYSQNNENSGVTIESVNPVDIRPSVYESEDGRIMFDILFDVCWSVQTIFGGNSKAYQSARVIRTIAVEPRSLLNPVLGDGKNDGQVKPVFDDEKCMDDDEYKLQQFKNFAGLGR